MDLHENGEFSCKDDGAQLRIHIMETASLPEVRLHTSNPSRASYIGLPFMDPTSSKFSKSNSLHGMRLKEQRKKTHIPLENTLVSPPICNSIC